MDHMATQAVGGLPKCDSVDTIRQSKEEQAEINVDMPQDDQHGDMLKVDDNFSANELLSFAWQIAKGMVSTAMITQLFSPVVPGYLIEQFGNRTQSNTNRSIAELNRT